MESESNMTDAPLDVVRILSEKLIPINFGWKTEHYLHRSIGEGDLSPDSLKFPHYFA